MELELFNQKKQSHKDRNRIIAINNNFSPSSDYLNFGYDYFDNPKSGRGYRGYVYTGRYYETAKKIIDHYKLKPNSKILEIGCAKGYLLYEFFKLKMDVVGYDISRYAVDNCIEELKEMIFLGRVNDINENDNIYDLAIAKEVLSHMAIDDILFTINKLQNISKNIYLVLQTVSEKKKANDMQSWDCTYKTMMIKKDWEKVLSSCGFHGDYQFNYIV